MTWITAPGRVSFASSGSDSLIATSVLIPATRQKRLGKPDGWENDMSNDAIRKRHDPSISSL